MRRVLIGIADAHNPHDYKYPLQQIVDDSQSVVAKEGAMQCHVHVNMAFDTLRAHLSSEDIEVLVLATSVDQDGEYITLESGRGYEDRVEVGEFCSEIRSSKLKLLILANNLSRDLAERIASEAAVDTFSMNIGDDQWRLPRLCASLLEQYSSGATDLRELLRTADNVSFEFEVDPKAGAA